MQYLKPFLFFVQKPGGWNNVLFTSLCVLIPIVGPIILLGYRSEMAEDLERDPDLEAHPNFDFNRFADYLSRGVWPFVAQLVITVLLMAGYGFAVVVGFGLGALTNEPIVGIIIGGFIYVLVSFLGMLLMWPLELYTQLRAKFEFGKSIAFTSRFLRTVGGQSVIALIVHMAISFVLIFVGMLACFVGVYPAAVISAMAQQHYMAQLYRIYLDEGGEPITSALDQIEFADE